jgi:hypothetical protein
LLTFRADSSFANKNKIFDKIKNIRRYNTLSTYEAVRWYRQLLPGQITTFFTSSYEAFLLSLQAMPGVIRQPLSLRQGFAQLPFSWQLLKFI